MRADTGAAELVVSFRRMTMDTRRFVFPAAIIVLFSITSLSQSEPNESPITRRPIFTASRYTAIGAWMPAPGITSFLTEQNEASISEEALFATYSFSHAGTTYNLEFYYRELYSRLRVRVLVGDRELKGLFSRFYTVDRTRQLMLSIHGWADGNPAVGFNFGGFLITESSLNTDAIYDAVEAFVGRSFPQTRNPWIRIERPPGLLRKTCEARVSGHYLVNEEGQVVPFTLENLLIAYCREGIKAERPEDFDRIGRSLVKAHSKALGVGINVISDINEIPRYSSKLLDSEKATEIRPPWSYRDSDSQTEYWACYTFERYGMGPLILACYKFGFEDGLVSSGERIILGEDRTGAFTGYTKLGSLRSQEKAVVPKNEDGTFDLRYSEPNNVRLPSATSLNDRGRGKADQSPSSSLAMLRVTFIAGAVFLLVLAYIVHRYVRTGSKVATHTVKNQSPAPETEDES
jgi:hypothetical protein